MRTTQSNRGPDGGPPPQSVVDATRPRKGEPPAICLFLTMAIAITIIYFGVSNSMGHYLFTGVIAGGTSYTSGYDEFNFGNRYIQFLWNWGDNFYFIPFADETTMGLFAWFYWFSVGQPEKALG